MISLSGNSADNLHSRIFFRLSVYCPKWNNLDVAFSCPGLIIVITMAMAAAILDPAPFKAA